MTAYQQGHRDFKGYVIRYGIDEARHIMSNYEQMVNYGIQRNDKDIDVEWEHEYIRGAKDATA